VPNATAGLPKRQISYRRVCNPTEAMSEQVTDVPPRKEPHVGRKRSIMGLGSASSCTQNAFEHAICAACNATIHGYHSSLSSGRKRVFFSVQKRVDPYPQLHNKARGNSKRFRMRVDLPLQSRRCLKILPPRTRRHSHSSRQSRSKSESRTSIDVSESFLVSPMV